MRTVGSFLLICGVISAALKLFLPYVYLAILVWIDNWGSQTGWAIRIGMIVVGAALIGLSMMKAKAASADSRNPASPGASKK